MKRINLKAIRFETIRFQFEGQKRRQLEMFRIPLYRLLIVMTFKLTIGAFFIAAN